MKNLLRTLLLPAAVTAVTAAALGGSPAQAAPQPAPQAAAVKVSIDGNDSPYGYVTSSRSACRSNVTVKVLEQVGARGGGDDIVRGTDGTGSDGSWSVGNPGFDDGDRIYAKVKARSGCKVGFSPTITVDKD